MTATHRPAPGEAADYYFKYIDMVPEGDVCATLERQMGDFVALLQGVPEARAAHAYAEGKWTIRDTVAHVIDTERLFVFRAFWFARGFDSPLPSFDPNVAAEHASRDERTWASLIDEFRALRASTVHFFRHLPDEAWSRRGIASGSPFTVRALAFLAAGHVAHHEALLRERYL